TQRSAVGSAKLGSPDTGGNRDPAGYRTHHHALDVATPPFPAPVAESTPPLDIGHVSHPRSSRQRYRAFVEDFKHRRLDEAALPSGNGTPKDSPRDKRDTRRQYVREYLRWLRPHRYAVAGVFALALVVAGLQMVEPLFMRFIIDRVLLNPSLDSAARLVRLNFAGALFVTVIVGSNLINLTKDYRQRLLNVHV